MYSMLLILCHITLDSQVYYYYKIMYILLYFHENVTEFHFPIKKVM